MNQEVAMARVELHTPAPDFELEDFRGRPFRLSGLRGQKRVVLVFNRGFL
jgi:peroxiredoxin